MTCRAVIMASPRSLWAPDPRRRLPGPGRMMYSSSPDRAQKVTAPVAPNTVNCSSTVTMARVVTVHPRAHSSGSAAAHAQRSWVWQGCEVPELGAGALTCGNGGWA